MKHIRRYLLATFSPRRQAVAIQADGKISTYVYLGLAAYAIITGVFLSTVFPGAAGSSANMMGVVAAALVLAPVLNLFVTAALLHGLIMLVSLKKQPFPQTLLAVALGTSPMATLAVIGVLAAMLDISVLQQLWSLIVTVWSVVIQIRVLGQLHNLKTARPLLAVVLTWIFWITGSLFIRAGVIESFRAPSQSMLPTIHVNENFFVKKYVSPSAMAIAGHVVIFEKPEDPTTGFGDPLAGTQFVKRVIGVANDRIKIINSKVYLNGEPLPRCHVGTWTSLVTDPTTGRIKEQTSSFWLEKLGTRIYGILEDFDMDSFEEVAVPNGHVFVMGDHRDRSADSRAWGAVPLQNLTGPATIVWWPPPSTDGNDASLNRMGHDVQGLPIPQPGQQQQFKKCVDELLKM